MRSAAIALVALAAPTILPTARATAQERTVRARVQPRVGADPEEFDMPVQRVPVDPPLLQASAAKLDERELVLGLVHGERSLAIPIRALSSFEVLNTHLGDLEVAPTW